jgi:hypothetical protein
MLEARLREELRGYLHPSHVDPDVAGALGM